MKKILSKSLAVIVAFMMSLNLLPSTFNPELNVSAVPVQNIQTTQTQTTTKTQTTPLTTFAADESKNAAILTQCAGEENGHGEGIKCVVILVVNILSVLVGIVGIIGIVIVGIQYLTAGGNEEQTRKAKRRLFEIVIGLAAYAIMAAFLNWLLPGFDTSDQTQTNSTSSLVITGA